MKTVIVGGVAAGASTGARLRRLDLEHLELGYAPPYSSAKDPLNMVGLLGSNLLRGDIDLCYPEVADRVTFLDTRTQAGYDAWHIPGAIAGAVLMPYTEIRQRLDEVPCDKPVYTYWRSGFRSYIAYCVLRQNGYEGVKFLSGGMMTYHAEHDLADCRVRSSTSEENA